MIDLLDHVTVEAAGGYAFERLAAEERNVREVMGQVQEKRALGLGPDESNRLFGVTAGDGSLVSVGVGSVAPISVAVVVGTGGDVGVGSTGGACSMGDELHPIKMTAVSTKLINNP